MPAASQRIERLRQHALEATVTGSRSAEGELLWLEGWRENRNASSNMVRRAAAKAYMHSHSTPMIDADELLVGKPCYRTLSDAEQAQLADYKREYADMGPRLTGQASHMAIDYEKLLSLGIDGVKEEIVHYRQGLILEDPEDMEKDDFYQACLISLDGVLAYAQHYAELALERAASCKDPTRKKELVEIGETLQVVPQKPAQTFRQALQSIQFVTFCLEGLYQLGRPDRYLIEFYRRDLAQGRITPESAQELIDCLCVLLNEYTSIGLAVGLMVGGRDAQGNDITNELSYLFIESIGHTRLSYPGIGLCCNPDTPRDILERSYSLLSEGLSHPALFNDEVITEGLKGYGLPIQDACQYIHSTCVEITPIANSAVWVASPYLNLVQLLLDMLGIPSLDEPNAPITAPQQFADWEAFKAEYRRRLGERIKRNAIEQNYWQMNRYYMGGDPLVSCFVNDCLSRGKDIDCGGARYNWIMPSFVGLSNLADSFMTIKQLVFEERRTTIRELVDSLRDDFGSNPQLYLQIRNHVAKYGNDDDNVDSMLMEITSWITEETGKLETYRGDRFIPSLFCWVMHERLGTNTAATPDGRRSGFPLGDGSGPAQGREANGPTASILSSTKWKHSPFIGGIAVNLKFSKALLGKKSQENMHALVKTFMERGGFELQVNVVDRETLLKARENPEEYRDLVVRVGGYSDYFIHLSPAMQEEVIARTGHAL